jgi:hypothetical protein
VRRPGNTALDHPAAGPQPEALLGLGQLHDFEVHAVRRGRRCWLVPGVTLIHKGDATRFARDGRHVFRQWRHLGPILHMSRGDRPGQQMPQSVDGQVHCPAAPAFRAVIARGPLSGVDCRVRLSKIAADGCSAQPSASLSTTRKSCTMASKTPVFTQRWVC